MKSKYTAVFFVFLTVSVTMNLYSKKALEDKNNKEQAGHADDISKLLTGNPYKVNKGNSQLITILDGIRHIMYLAVDSTMKKNEDYSAVNTAIGFLKENMKPLNFDSISNFHEFLTPGGKTHGLYSHLGWDHIYPDDDIQPTTRGDIVVNTQKRWGIRKKILIDAMGKTFDFSILESKKKDSLGALFYYVHILGDHEDDDITTANTRLPIENKNEQMSSSDFPGWFTYDKRWVPGENETIIKELIKHLEILFSDQRGKPNGLYYDNLMRGLNGYLSGNQREKARYVLYLLFSNVPSLLKESSFAKDFYKKYQIIVNTYIPNPYIIMPEEEENASYD